ncbi:MAG: HAD family hydrolase [Candidatus Hodarchaeota archaeon]
MKNTKFKLVFFDFDQTIINSGVGFSAAYKKMAEDFKLLLENQDVKLDPEVILKKILAKDKEFNKNKFYNRDLWWNPILNEFNVKQELNQDELKRLTESYWNTVIENTEPYPDTFEILDYLKSKYKLALISDTDGLKGMKKLRIQKSNIAHYFDYIIVPGDDTQAVKPDPEPFLQIVKMAKVNASKEECIMVGDKPFTDIKGAKNAGFTTVLILRTDWKVEPTPDYIIKELLEIKKIL